MLSGRMKKRKMQTVHTKQGGKNAVWMVRNILRKSVQNVAHQEQIPALEEPEVILEQ